MPALFAARRRLEAPKLNTRDQTGTRCLFSASQAPIVGTTLRLPAPLARRPLGPLRLGVEEPVGQVPRLGDVIKIRVEVALGCLDRFVAEDLLEHVKRDAAVSGRSIIDINTLSEDDYTRVHHAAREKLGLVGIVRTREDVRNYLVENADLRDDVTEAADFLEISHEHSLHTGPPICSSQGGIEDTRDPVRRP